MKSPRKVHTTFLTSRVCRGRFLGRETRLFHEYTPGVYLYQGALTRAPRREASSGSDFDTRFVPLSLSSAPAGSSTTASGSLFRPLVWRVKFYEPQIVGKLARERAQGLTSLDSHVGDLRAAGAFIGSPRTGF